VTGRIRTALVVTGHDHFLALVLKDDLGTSKYVAGRDQSDVHLAYPNDLLIGRALRARLRTIAALHDRQCFGCRENRTVTAACVVRMSVGDHRAGLWL
jgi:hypothetical protein